MTCLISARIPHIKAAPRKDAHRLKYRFVALIVDPVPQWHVDRISFAFSNTIVPHLSRPREELPILVETTSHDSIRQVKRLLDSISVVHVNVDIEDSLMIPQELQDAENDVCGSASRIPRKTGEGTHR